MTLDPDDMLSAPDSLENVVDIIKKYDIDIVQFNFMTGDLDNIYKYIFLHNENELRVIRQPELSYISYYSNYPEMSFKKSIVSIIDKVIRREILLKVVEILREYLPFGNWNYFEDTTISYLVMKYAETYIYTNKLSYFYFVTGESLWSGKNNKKGEMILKSCLLFSKVLFKNTSNKIEDKKIAFYEWRQCHEFWHSRQFLKGKYKDEYINIGNIFLESKYLTDEERKKIEKIIKIYS